MSRKGNDLIMSTLVKQEAAVVNRRQSIWSKMLSQWELYLFLLPAVVCLIIFSYKPMYGILMAFKNFKISIGVNDSEWIGVEHPMRGYINFRENDPQKLLEYLQEIK